MEDMSLTGSSSVSSDKLDSVNDTNGLNSVSKVDNNRISGLIASSDDENEGFVSGVEDFETNLDENSGDVVNVDEEKFAEASEVPAPKVVVDDEKDNSGLVENSKLNEGVKEEGVGGSEGDKVSGSKEVVVDETAPKSLSGDDVKSGSPMEGGEEVVEANGVTGGDSVVEDLKVDTPAPGVAVVSSTEDVTTDEDEGVVLVGGPDDPNAIDEETDVETDGINDVKTTSEGDSVVEAVDVDVPLPGVAGVAVVTKTEEVGAETVAVNDVKATSEGDSVVEARDVDLPLPGVAEAGVVTETEEVEVETIGVNDVNATSEGDSVVEAADVDLPLPGVEEAAVVTKTGEVGVETVGVNDVNATSEGDSVVEAVDVDLPLPGVAEAAVDTKTEEVGVETVGINDANATSEGVETVGVNDVNATSEGDSVVEAVDVDLPLPGAPGVAVVTKTEEVGGDLAVAHESGSPEKMDRLLEEVVDKEVVGVTEGKFSPLVAEDSVDYDAEKNEKNMEVEVEKGVDYEGKEILDKAMPDDVVQAKEVLSEDIPNDADEKAKHVDMGAISTGVEDSGLENGMADKFVLEESAEKDDADEEGYMDSSPSEEETDGVIFGSSEAAKQFMVELERGSGEGGGSNTGGESSQDHPQMIDGQIVTDSDEEDDEEDGKELFDSAALAALLKAAAEGGSEGGNITFSSQDGSRLFTVERPAGLGPSLQTMRAAPRPARPNIFNPSSLMSGGESDSNLSEEEKKKLEKLQLIRVKFLRLVQRLGLSQDESVAAQVLYRLALIAGRQTGQFFSLDAAKRKAVELEAEGIDDLDFSVNILVIGKAGVGKSATINSIFGEEKTGISAFQPATAAVKEIRGMVGGVMIRVFDTPGLRSSVMDQGFNRSVLSLAKRFTKKNPPDIVLYVDRLDAQTRDHNDIPLLKTITSSLGPSIWRSAIVTLTHGASAPPEGSNGIPLSYEMFVTQRSHVVQQAIGQAVGDLRMMSPSLMNPVSLVENHQSCRKNREGQKVLPNGQTWRPQLLMLCYSMKILAEANSFSKPQDPYDTRKLFGFRGRSPPLPYMLSSMLQSRAHPKLSSEQGGDGGDSDIDLADLSDSDQEEDEDEYDLLPPFKPLKRSQLSKLNREQKKAYFDEYDYRVKLLQKKQWKEELKRMREMKKKGKDAVNDQSYPEEEGEGDAPAPVAVPLPDMALPPSFDSDNPAYRFRFLEPTSQFLARPVLDTHGWDHDCGYDGVNLEQSLAIANRFPAAVSVQVTKDKKDFSINLDSSVSTKHGEKGSSMAGFDVQPIGKQLAYIVRGETKFKNLKKNKTAAGMSVTFLGENVVTGFKVEDQIVIGKQFSVIGSAGTVRFQKDSAYGANIEVQRRELDYPIGQVQSTIGLSIIKWRGDLALGFNSLAQFSAGRNSKVAVRAGINNKMSGQITVKTSSSEHLSLALAAVIPSVISAYKKLWPAAGEKYSPY